jgi:hypothetical protein
VDTSAKHLKAIDIGETPWEFLSNFMAYAFVFRGFAIAGMEGLLQSLKTPLVDKQTSMFALSGIKAKYKGKKMKWWLPEHGLYWQGEHLDRFSPAYHDFIEEAFTCMFEQNDTFRQALLATGNSPLTHSHGKSDPRYTILTEDEFTRVLTRLRDGDIKAKVPKIHKASTTGRYQNRADVTQHIFSLHGNTPANEGDIAQYAGISVAMVAKLIISLEYHIWASIESNLTLKENHNPDSLTHAMAYHRDQVIKMTQGENNNDASQ